MADVRFPVLHLITELSVGGAQMALLRLLEGMDRSRFAPTVACLYNGDGASARQMRALGIPVTDLGMAAKWRWDALWRLYRLLRRTRPAVLHTWMFHANVPGRLLGRLAGVPAIVSSERTMGQEGVLRRSINRLSAPLADRIICVSQHVSDFARCEVGLPAEKLVVIPNGVRLADYAHLPGRAEARSAHALPVAGDLIGAVGRPRPVKGYEFLLDAFARLSGDWPGARLLFVGSGPSRPALQEQAARLRLADRVTFMDDRADVPNLLPALDLLALPSLHEGMPNVALEAMAAGLPVVATAVGGTPEVVVDGITGLLVPPRDPEALARAAACLLDDPGLRERMGRAGRARVEQHFSVERTVQQTEQLYAQVLAEKGLLRRGDLP